jgi:hypothetical protein
MTEKQVQSLYKKYNQKFFDGKLPAEVPVKFVDMASTDYCGLTTMFSEPGLTLQVIYLDTKLKAHTNLLKFTLLHEMVHIKAPSAEHGQDFDDEMMRLAFRGAFKGIW